MAPPARRRGLELLELGDGSDDEVRANLREMAFYNRWLGGLLPLKRHVWPAVEAAARQGRTARVLEAGCGSAALSAWLAAKARRAGVDLRMYGLDLAGRNLTVRQPDVGLLEADMTASPFADGAFDAAFSTFTLHHLEPPTIIRAARELVRLTRGPVVLNDLVRGRAPELLFHLTKHLLARCRLTRHDGLLSIQRGYTSKEIRAILAEGGFRGAEICEDWPWFRMTAVIRA